MMTNTMTAADADLLATLSLDEITELRADFYHHIGSRYSVPAAQISRYAAICTARQSIVEAQFKAEYAARKAAR